MLFRSWHAYFWSWLDDTPKAPWLMAAPFGQWVKKMAYKSSVSDVRLWVERKALPMEDGSLLSRSREELLGALAKAAAEGLPADQAASGQLGGSRQAKLGELPGIRVAVATRRLGARLEGGPQCRRAGRRTRSFAEEVASGSLGHLRAAARVTLSCLLTLAFSLGIAVPAAWGGGEGDRSAPC